MAVERGRKKTGRRRGRSEKLSGKGSRKRSGSDESIVSEYNRLTEVKSSCFATD
jgi:hypothetical protein